MSKLELPKLNAEQDILIPTCVINPVLDHDRKENHNVYDEAAEGTTRGFTPAETHEEDVLGRLSEADDLVKAIAKQHSRNVWEELGGWKIELFASGIYVASLLALVATLLRLRGNPLPDWSLNSLISIYASIFKSSLVFVVGSAIS